MTKVQKDVAQAGLVISRSRGQAAKRLLRIAADMENPETARKACVDLLNVKTVEEHQVTQVISPISASDHRSVLESLEQLGGIRHMMSLMRKRR